MDLLHPSIDNKSTDRISLLHELVYFLRNSMFQTKDIKYSHKEYPDQLVLLSLVDYLLDSSHEICIGDFMLLQDTMRHSLLQMVFIQLYS